MLARRFPELQPVLDEMAEDHVGISGVLARVEELAGELAATGSPDRRPASWGTGRRLLRRTARCSR
ncbi:hypothetical protein ACI79Z_06395 [Geodermatophilus sp. SYSU D00663]